MNNLDNRVIVILIVIIIIIMIIMGIKNKLVKLKNAVRNAESSLDVYLKERFDLIPNLVNVVKSYKDYEEETITKIVESRNKFLKTNKLSDGISTNNRMDNLIAYIENYPELKANENYLKLQEELVKIESKLQAARRVYNSEVNTYNNYIMSVPKNIFAKIFNYKPIDYFEIDENEKDSIKVEM